MKKNTAKPSRRQAYNKKELFAGIISLLIAFACVFVIFYLVAKSHRQQGEEYSALEEKMTAVNIERQAVKEQAQELKAKVGTSISLEKLLAETQKAYGPDEKNRREGFLWIDHSAEIMYVTLGAVQGLTPGDKLIVSEGDREIGSVRVETPLDVISYVRPINNVIGDYPLEYYRVKIPGKNY